MNRFIFIFFLFFFSFNCTSERKKNSVQSSSIDSLVTKVYIEPPKLSWIGTDSQGIYFDNKIKVDPIRNGFDSFQLRISYDDPLEKKGGGSSKILIIKNQNAKWDGEVIKIIPLQSNDSLFYSVISQKRNISPKSGWNKFISQLFSFRLLKEPFYILEEEGPVVHEPTSISFQIATKTEFRSYRYLIPSFYEKEYWQIGDLKEIIKLLENELDFKVK